ncbi:hypothetical protein FRC10_011851 [Ceratobasidium sp. 414]|nr:hypothetical protein FRC10_011851 [Ceratobasidium sp. 414]
MGSQRIIAVCGATELAQSGVEVVYADYNDLESLVAAFRGCYGVYGVTNWFEAFEGEREQGFNLVRAAKAVNIQHFVLSADTNDFLIASGIPRTSIYLTFYYSNMFLFDAIHKRADGALHLNLPFPTDSPIPSLAASDVGGFVLAAFLDPSKWVGQDMRLCTEYITPRQYATIFEEVSGIPVHVHEVTLDEFMQMEGNPYPSDVWSM